MDEVTSIATMRLADAIRETDVYRAYETEKQKLAKFPALKQGIDEYRKRSFEIQNSEDSDEVFERIDEFEKEYSEFLENPFVDDFLEAELSLCRMMQGIFVRVTEAIDFDMDLSGGNSNEQ